MFLPLPTALAPNSSGVPVTATHRVIRALRIAALAQQAQVDPQPRLNDLLGSGDVARNFRLLIAAMAQAWPDPLVVFRPCCPRVTHDEGTLLAMLHHARAGDRPAFDRLLADLIGADGRDYLYCASVRLALSLTA